MGMCEPVQRFNVSTFQHGCWAGLRFWGVAYTLTFYVGMTCLVVVMWLLSVSNLLMRVFMSAIWWGIWALITWAVVRFPGM